MPSAVLGTHTAREQSGLGASIAADLWYWIDVRSAVEGLDLSAWDVSSFIKLLNSAPPWKLSNAMAEQTVKVVRQNGGRGSLRSVTTGPRDLFGYDLAVVQSPVSREEVDQLVAAMKEHIRGQLGDNLGGKFGRLLLEHIQTSTSSPTPTPVENVYLDTLPFAAFEHVQRDAENGGNGRNGNGSDGNGRNGGDGPGNQQPATVTPLLIGGLLVGGGVMLLSGPEDP